MHPCGLLPQSPFWNTAFYNRFSRFSENVAMLRAASLSVSTLFPVGVCSDVACRVAILSTLRRYLPPRRSPLIIACRPPRDKWVGWRCVRWHPRVGVYVGRWRYPVMPPVGVGSLLCEDFPARPLSACLHGDGSVAEHKKQAVSPDTACHAWWDEEEFGGRLLVPALRLL